MPPVLPAVTANQLSQIAKRYAQKDLSWLPVLAFLPARLGLALLAQALTAGLMAAQGVPDPWPASRGWWMVYGTLTDLGCLALLAWLAHREGLKLLDLLGLQGDGLGRHLQFFLGYLLAFLPFLVLTAVVAGLFYGSQMAPQVGVIHLPPWADLYSVVVWPVLWGFTEELVYLGYLLPRLQALTKRTWLAAIIVIVFWGLQHIVIPFIPDAQYLVARFLTATVTVGGLTLIFVLWGRRMVPAIGVHWLSDILAALLAVSMARG